MKNYPIFSLKISKGEKLRRTRNPRYFLRYLQKIASGLFIEFTLCLSSPREQPYSPWRVLFPSPLRFCHVTLGGSNRPYSQRRVALLASRARGCSRLFGFVLMLATASCCARLASNGVPAALLHFSWLFHTCLVS